METNPILHELEGFSKLTSGKQKAFYEQMLKDAKSVKISSIYESFTQEEIQKIKSIVKPKAKQCYKNSSMLTKTFTDKDVLYVEGRYTVLGMFSTEHAFNKVGDKYVDITSELANGKSIDEINKEAYISLCEVGVQELVESEEESQVYGNVYVTKFIKNNY